MARAADFGKTARSVKIVLAQRGVDLRGGDAKRLHPRRIKDHLDLPVDPTKTLHFSHARYLQQPLGHRIVDEPAQLLKRHVIRFNRSITDRLTHHVDLADLGFKNAVGQTAAHRINRGFHLVDRFDQVGADLEFDEGLR